MADIGRLLLPPLSIVAGRSSLVRISDGKGGDRDAARDEQGQVTRIDETPDATSGGRAKQFRFRVVDGGRSDQLAGNAEVPARTQPNQDSTAEATGAKSSQAATGRGSQGNAVPLGTPQATFLAQLIAQEQLAPGLYDPPVKAADRAYRQAGGEPALSDSTRSTSRYQIAV
ncbi:MAG: hypothetical protein IPK59_14430 [Rhodospirillaceae bacterium]|nr:hypothetical protein [Rhodospirillaceae bacterium]